MCAIFGMIQFDGRPVDPVVLDRCTDSMAHRGPDGRGVYCDGPVGLGHRRLAIIDLTGGEQPMANEDGRVRIAFNGEIYNFRELRAQLERLGHRFRTQSDTEAIIHAYEEWGSDCLQRLRGMFALAIWDGRKRELFLARDRVGIKPLYYTLNGDRCAFASELGALVGLDGVDREIDLAALDAFLHFQYIPAPLSIYRGVRKLLPAHWMRLHADGRVEGPQRYWDMQFEPDDSLTEGQWIERFGEGLRDAVRSHLVSDVPFGAFLSGGIDSSSIVACMSDVMDRPVETFTIGFEGWAAGDEREPARVAAAALGTHHHVRMVEPNGLELLPQLVRYYGEPFGDSSAICTYAVARAARQAVKMVLSGDGGDETLAGYSYFPKMVTAYQSPNDVRSIWRRRAGAILRRAGLRHAAPSLADAWYDRSPCFGDSWRVQLWRPEHRDRMSASRQWNEARFAEARGDVLSRCQYVDIHNYLPYDNLCKVDVATMANGLEVRVPLLDHVLLEIVAKIPSNLRLRVKDGAGDDGLPSSTGKYLLRKATEGHFPPGFYDRPKRGFSVPVSDWFARTAYTHLRERLEDQRGGLAEWFDPVYIRRLCEEHRNGVADHGHRLYALLFLAEWRAETVGVVTVSGCRHDGVQVSAQREASHARQAS